MIIVVLPDIAVEDRLLSRARRGDENAVRDIYALYFPSIYRYIRLRVENATEAEDLASDVFVRLVKALRSANAPRSSLRGWLFQVARNGIADHHGKEKRMTMTALDEWIADGSEDLEISSIRSLDAERARRSLSQLTSEQQEVLVFRFGQGLSLQETADIMGKNTNTIKQLQFRAVSALRRILSEMNTERPYA